MLEVKRCCRSFQTREVMARPSIKLQDEKRLKARRAFEAGKSNREISVITGVSQLVWERELRSSMGDDAFEEQLARNKQKNRRLGRPPRVKTAAQLQQIKARKPRTPFKKGKAVPIVCEQTGQVFDSISKAAASTKLSTKQIKRSLAEGVAVCRPGRARSISFRLWREGDGEVRVVQGRGAIPLRFTDGRCYPSVSALAREMNAQPRHIAAFCRRLKEIGYSASSEALPLAELRRIAVMLPMLERHQLDQRILESELQG